MFFDKKNSGPKKFFGPWWEHCHCKFYGAVFSDSFFFSHDEMWNLIQFSFTCMFFDERISGPKIPSLDHGENVAASAANFTVPFAQTIFFSVTKQFSFNCMFFD